MEFCGYSNIFCVAHEMTFSNSTSGIYKYYLKYTDKNATLKVMIQTSV